ncbi:MAG: hypothetical protein RL329_2744 [Bacteroidota bacterium]|jgi:hypothetical protein
MKKNIFIFYFLMGCFLLPAQNFPVETVLDNGLASKRIKFVFLSDGYQSSELPNFIIKTSEFKDYILTQTPFKEYQRFFNFYAVKVPSTDSGCKHDSTASDENTSGRQPISAANTYFNSKFDTEYGGVAMHRFVAPQNTAAVLDVAASNFPNYNQIFMICNSPYYGGSGGSDVSGISTSTAHSSAPDVAAHEIGHSFANLADEYEIDGQGELPNRTINTNPNTVKWKNWMGDQGIGIYDIGVGGWQRPHQNCKMQHLGAPFCAVCREAIVNSIYQLVTPIYDYAPASTTVTASNSMTFSATLTNPIPNTLQSDWKLNGISMATNVSTINLSPAQLSAGANTLTLYVTDTTPFSRTYLPNSGYIFSQTWTIHTSTLPLELLHFKAEKQAETVLLNWQTTNEQNTSHFDIERSTDATHFWTIGTVKSQNKTALNDYHFTDAHLPSGILYYRLKQVDNDGKTTLSPIRSIEKSDKFYYNLSPNPTQNVLTINGNADYDLTATVEMWNEIGIRVYQKEVVVNKGVFEQKIDMTNFIDGTYMVFLRLPNGFSVKKMVVKVTK